MFAQLAATKQFDPYTQRTEWFKHFAKIMKIVFWVMESDFFVEYKTKDTSFTVDKVFQELLDAIAIDQDVKTVFTKTNVFKELPGNDRAVTLFYDNGGTGRSGNFQLNSATQDSHGNVVMVLGAMNFESTQHTTRFLFFTFESSSTKIFQGVQKIVLNELQYGRVRQQIIDKLGKNAHDKIADIPI